MHLVKVKCAFCGKEYLREVGRVNEAKKFGWNQYCSKECQSRAKKKKIEKPCGNPNCNKIVSRPLSQFKKSKSGLVFCSRSCAAIVNNRKSPKRKAEFRICVICGKRFKKSVGNSRFCSIKCYLKAKQKYTPQKLIEIIRQATKNLKRVPARRELEKIYHACAKYFGSWNGAILAAGFQPNRSHNQRMYKCLKIKAKDGHLCNSASEALIDDWLTKNNIFHEKDAPYPETNHRADWAIFINGKRVFIEYFGLANDSPRYDRTVQEKKKLCQKHRIPLIEIYHWDLYPKRRLEEKVKNGLRNVNFLLTSQGGESCTPVLRFPKPAS